MKTYVTGIGVVSAIGLNLEENFLSLKAGVTGIKKSFEHNVMLAEVKLSNDQIIHKLGVPDADYSRTTLLALHGAKEAWRGNVSDKAVRTGLISSTSIGGIDRTEKYYFESRDNPASLKRMTHDNGRTTERIAVELGISGFIGTISTACSSGANAIMHGARLIQGNKLDRVIVGGCDPIALFDVKGFSSLNVYDHQICKPFDENRKGLNLGEGAGFLVIESEKSVAITGNTVLCELSGWNNSSDAYHQTASSPTGEGARLAMIKALAKAAVSPEKISYINAHGTGTGNNDLSESIAIKSVFGEHIPRFSSTKGFTGHTLAGAGAIEAVFCVLSILEQSTFPNLNFTTPMHETGMIPETQYTADVAVEHVLSNSFGFGGNCTCLIFSKVA